MIQKPNINKIEAKLIGEIILFLILFLVLYYTIKGIIWIDLIMVFIGFRIFQNVYRLYKFDKYQQKSFKHEYHNVLKNGIYKNK
ncbi:MAG: hypothetical protein ACOCV1_08665 [Bacillota bacterium]